jgi:P-type conjugative transfer protein TrbG
MKVFKLGAFIFGLTCFTALTTTQAASLPAGNGVKSAKTFIYQLNAIYTIYCQAGRVSDIQLQPGEEIKSIGGGDSAHWIVDKDISGTGGNRQWHVWIKPVASGITTNFIVNTDRRIYHLEAYGTINRSNPIVNWRYPQDERTALLRKQEEEQRVIAIKSLSFENLNLTTGFPAGAIPGNRSWSLMTDAKRT